MVKHSARKIISFFLVIHVIQTGYSFPTRQEEIENVDNSFSNAWNSFYNSVVESKQIASETASDIVSKSYTDLKMGLDKAIKQGNKNALLHGNNKVLQKIGVIPVEEVKEKRQVSSQNNDSFQCQYFWIC